MSASQGGDKMNDSNGGEVAVDGKPTVQFAVLSSDESSGGGNAAKRLKGSAGGCVAGSGSGGGSGSTLGGPPTVPYRDYSRDSPDSVEKHGGAENFPMKLHEILSNPEFQDVIAWLPHGRAWRILQHKAFEERVIPLYFRHGRYSSFARQVNGWNFKRITSGPDYNSYYHELFLRGKPYLCRKMKRITSKDVKGNNDSSNGDAPAPDFYAISRDHPLPELPGFRSQAQIEADTAASVTGGAAYLTSMGGLDFTQVGDSKESELAVLERRRQEILARMSSLQGQGGAVVGGHAITPTPPVSQDNTNNAAAAGGPNSALLALLQKQGLNLGALQNLAGGNGGQSNPEAVPSVASLPQAQPQPPQQQQQTFNLSQLFGNGGATAMNNNSNNASTSNNNGGGGFNLAEFLASQQQKQSPVQQQQHPQQQQYGLGQFSLPPQAQAAGNIDLSQLLSGNNGSNGSNSNNGFGNSNDNGQGLLLQQLRSQLLGGSGNNNNVASAPVPPPPTPSNNGAPTSINDLLAQFQQQQQKQQQQQAQQQQLLAAAAQQQGNNNNGNNNQLLAALAALQAQQQQQPQQQGPQGGSSNNNNANDVLAALRGQFASSNGPASPEPSVNSSAAIAGPTSNDDNANSMQRKLLESLWANANKNNSNNSSTSAPVPSGVSSDVLANLQKRLMSTGQQGGGAPSMAEIQRLLAGASNNNGNVKNPPQQQQPAIQQDQPPSGNNSVGGGGGGSSSVAGLSDLQRQLLAGQSQGPSPAPNALAQLFANSSANNGSSSSGPPSGNFLADLQRQLMASQAQQSDNNGANQMNAPQVNNAVVQQAPAPALPNNLQDALRQQLMQAQMGGNSQLSAALNLAGINLASFANARSPQGNGTGNGGQ